MRHISSSPQLEAGIGIALVVAGFWILHQAYDGRGRKMPLALGPFVPW
jgi:hypothetical protein